MAGPSTTARAKINLTLRVLGRRPDGFHALDSVVAFAAVGDSIVMAPGKPRQVDVFGPFGAAIVGENLVTKAVSLALEAEPRLEIGHIAIEKVLPVAAGIGGGSADAAALLRLIRAANPHYAPQIDWMALAARLGSDVPVCLMDRACRMRGRGDVLKPVTGLPPLSAVLANPQVAVPADKTRQVFTRLAAAPFAAQSDEPVTWPQDRNGWLDWIAARGNDLEAAAIAVVPAAADVLIALRSQPATRVARLSGAGPTCFALTASQEEAAKLAAHISSRHPNWWVRETTIS